MNDSDVSPASRELAFFSRYRGSPLRRAAAPPDVALSPAAVFPAAVFPAQLLELLAKLPEFAVEVADGFGELADLGAAVCSFAVLPGELAA